MEIIRILELAEQHNFVLHEYEEQGIVCGYEMETWTDNGVNMIHFIDCRMSSYPDGLTAQNVLEELKKISAYFDVDLQVDSHRESDRFRMAFSIRQALEDFEGYEARLTEFVRVVQEEFDSASEEDRKEKP